MSSGYDLKKEEEVKQFIKNLGIEYRYGCYKENKGEVCHLLGDYLDTIEKNTEKANDIYKRNCEENHFPQSCYKYGNQILKGDAEKLKDLTLLKKANEFYVKACNLDHPEACQMAAQTGISIIKDKDKFATENDYSECTRMLEKSCDLGCPQGCFTLGSFYLEMLNFEKAEAPLTKSCEMLNPYACANLSVMYRNGDGVEKNKDLSNTFKLKALELFKEYTRERDPITFQRGLPPVS